MYLFLGWNTIDLRLTTFRVQNRSALLHDGCCWYVFWRQSSIKQSHTEMCMIALLLLDIISTLDVEIEHMWKRKLNWVGVLFYMVRKERREECYNHTMFTHSIVLCRTVTSHPYATWAF